jgi:hypothetical protein
VRLVDRDQRHEVPVLSEEVFEVSVRLRALG